MGQFAAGVSREKYYKIHEPSKGIPPVGYYRSKFHQIDKYQPAAGYGPKENWDNALIQKSFNIKEKDFI